MGRHPWARLRAALPRVSVFLAMAGLVAAPLLVYFALHPEHFFYARQIYVGLRSGS